MEIAPIAANPGKARTPGKPCTKTGGFCTEFVIEDPGKPNPGP